MEAGVQSSYSMRKLALLLLIVNAAGCAASAQIVSFGVEGGVPVLDRTQSPDESRPYIIGPSVEVRLPAGFALEAEALYQRIGTTRGFASFPALGITSFTDHERGNSWEFPFLAKYYFRPRNASWQPFIGTGYAFRMIGLHDSITQTVLGANGSPQATSFHDSFRSNLGVGAVVAAGLRFRVGRIALLPEFRYTRWGGVDNVTRQNEAGVLLGISF